MISENLPPIAIPAPDYSLLDPLARTAARNKHPVARFLLEELRRANICAEAELPANTVRLNNWVTYRLDWGWPSESRMLVRPQDYRGPAAHLSVLSPLGAALLGLSAGARMPFVTLEGVLHVVTAESLEPPMGVLSLLRPPSTKRAPGAEAGSADPFDPDDPGPAAA
jgi:regulator of nucleoside diphosphate kinase